MDIEELIERGETQSLEFKESLRLKDEIGETVSAFSNSDGGTVIVGVSNSGGVLGVDIGKDTLEKLANYIKRNTDPQIFPSVKILEVDGKRVVMIEVKESAEKPVFFKNHGYKRVGKTNQMISSSELRKLAKESGGKIYWDERVCEDASLEDIEEDKVRWYLERREEIRKVKKPEKMDIETLLLNIGAAKKVNSETKPTNAGILFFGKNPQRFVLQSQLRTARFAGKTLTRDFLDRLDCSGSLWEMVEGSEDFVRKNIRLFGFRTEYSFQRIDKLEYPIKAIREGIINALIHRNYFEPADTRVAIFDDRIEIISPGSFPEGVTPEEPKHVPVNPILCQLMYDVGFIEKYGSGIYMINVLEKGFITNRSYQELNDVGKKTAYLELSGLIEKGLLLSTGKGRSVRYVARF